MAKQITDEDRKNIREYLLAIKELGAAEPEHDYSNPESMAAWDKWNGECIALNNRYGVSITRALLAGKVSGIGSVEQYLTSFLNESGEGSAPDAAHIPQLKSTLPRTHIIPNNKLANTMVKDVVGIGQFTLKVSARNAKNPVRTICILSYDKQNVDVRGREPFTEYDRNVYNAVASLYVYGDPSHIITPAMVYRAMTGMQNTEYISPKQIDSVTHSLDKMRFMRAQIDCTAELKMRNATVDSKQIRRGIIDTYLLAADAIDVEAGGQTVKAYSIIKPPVLYEYSASVKQVLQIPSALLDVKELDSAGNVTACSISNSDSRIQIKGYLLRRIEGMKGDNRLNNPVIALSDYERDGERHRGLYSIAGYPTPSKTEASRIRTSIEKMLSYWQAINHISGFDIVKEGQKAIGYRILI